MKTLQRLSLIFLLLVFCASVFAQEVNEQIMSEGVLNAQQLVASFKKKNKAQALWAERLAQIYIEEAQAEGVNSDIAYAQMIQETGWLEFRGIVKAFQNNFCGLGATDSEHPGFTFDDERTGIRAHIQHLKAYASEEFLNNEKVDPRFHLVKRGSAPMLSDLKGKWAVDPSYDQKIRKILQEMYHLM
ncbi:MAG: glucosaminidase domain-containing protein [Dysgonamonadaceae bacterium]|jgi:hypothetical protein|nr:glucosaminidase domain-containing protein [Dysgonamonadaceae bacterium]